MFRRSFSRVRGEVYPQIDWFLLILVTGLTTLGGLTIRSTELSATSNNWLQHYLFGAIGLLIVLFLARWRYDYLLRLHWIIYGLTNAILIAVKIIGVSANGAQSWVSILGIRIEPSEFAKLGVIISLAALLHQKPVKTPLELIRVLAITGVPWALIFLQPDLGTSLVFGAITLGVLYWANTNRGWLLLLVSPIISVILFNVYFQGWIFWTALLLVVAWLSLPWRIIGTICVLIVTVLSGRLGQILWSVLKNYQKERILVFLDPDKDMLGSGYQLTQSRIAIGSGGLWGKGLYQGPQTQLNFVPEQHTDFIFSAVGEEWGFVGSVIVVLVLWLICLRLIIIACTASDNFGSLLVIGIFSMIIFQVVVNIGMTIGLAPITGIPLPWMTYGRSSLMTNFIAIGLAESVANYRPRKKDY